MRKTSLAQGEYFHLFNRGNDKQTLFKEKVDWARFLFLLLHGQSSIPIHNTKRYVEHFTHNGSFGFTKQSLDKILGGREVELVSFSIMPNHFHIIAGELSDGGISRYMQRVQTAYAMYFNTKHERSGHVFQGSFGSTHISTNEQLIYTSAYVHLNPADAPQCKFVHTFPWSSYQDYLTENRWGELLSPGIILDQFKTPKDYERSVNNSGAKEFTLGPT